MSTCDAIVTVVVVARNEAARIERCMRSLAAQENVNFKVLLVDDGSTDETIELARAFCPGLDVIESPTRSIARNRDVGWRNADTKYVAFLDADCEAPTDWLATLVSAFERTGAAGVGGGNVPPEGEGVHYEALAVMLDTWAGSHGSTQGKVPVAEVEVDYLPGLNAAFRRDALELVNGYDPEFARMAEDVDLSIRLRNIGLNLIAVPGAVVTHRQRSDFFSWARNMRGYGRGRTKITRRHPNVWSAKFLIPPLTIVLFPVYLAIILAYSLLVSVQAGKLMLWPRVAVLFIATHWAYAFGQVEQALQKKRRRVGLISLKNAGNKGDEALAVVIAERIGNRLRSATEDDLYLAGFGPSGLDIRAVPESRHALELLVLDLLAPSSEARETGLVALPGFLARCMLFFSRFDAILIAGGQWLHDLSLPKHIAISGFFAIARLSRVKTGVFCVGTGPLKRSISRWLVRLAFGPKSFMSVRDDASANLLRESGLSQTISAADPAIELDSVEVLGHEDKVLISPCAWASFQNIYNQDESEIARSVENWRKVVGVLKDRGHSVAFLPTMNPEDAMFAENIGFGDDVPVIAVEQLTPSEVQGIIAKSKALISMRLHPAIFASNCAVPFVALNYAAKVRGYCEQAGLGHRLVEIVNRDWADDALRVLDLSDADNATIGGARVDQLSRLSNAYGQLFEWLGVQEPAVQDIRFEDRRA